MDRADRQQHAEAAIAAARARLVIVRKLTEVADQLSFAVGQANEIAKQLETATMGAKKLPILVATLIGVPDLPSEEQRFAEIEGDLRRWAEHG